MTCTMNQPPLDAALRQFSPPGWCLLGSYPDGEPDDVGSWLLYNGGEALLLETPPGLGLRRINASLAKVSARLKYVTASHDHEDHLCQDVWEMLGEAFPKAGRRHPKHAKHDPSYSDHCCFLGGEPVWIIKAPKHSMSDQVVVFRGVAMTGDIELGTLASVNDEVPVAVRRQSMDWLREFQQRRDYRVHTVLSAHLNDLRTNVDWESLFRC